MEPRDPLTATDGATCPTPSPQAVAAAKALEQQFGGRWIPWVSGPTAPREQVMWIRVDDVDGRQTVTGMLVLGDPLSASDLRKIQLGAVEAALNVQHGGGGEGAVGPEALPPLVRDPGMRAEDWSRLVAAHYTAWARRGGKPGAEMARRWGANRQTVAAWIHEARLRGLLPPARRTKGGRE